MKKFERNQWLVGASILAIALAVPYSAGLVVSSLAWAQTEEESEAGEASDTTDSSEASEKSQTGEGGESGESGESGVDKGNKLDGATLLTLAQGHLLVSVELYRAGDHVLARGHASHPEKELLSALKDELSELGESGLSGDLEAFEQAVAEERSLDEVEAAYANVDREIDRLRSLAEPDLAAALKTIATALREAGKEYSEGVKDGKVVDRAEYADAFGFVLASRDLLDQVSDGSDASKQAVINGIKTDLDTLNQLFPSLDAEEASGQASQLYGAAARVDIAAGKVK